MDIFLFFDLDCKFTHNMHIGMLVSLNRTGCWKGAMLHSCTHKGKREASAGTLGKAGCWRLTCVRIDFLVKLNGPKAE